MYSDEASCSDCKLELITNRWNNLLLKWLNKCVNSKTIVKELNPRSLVDVINKYKHDICADDIDRAILCTDDIEPFLRYKYPILRLRYLSEDKDLPKKLYIMTSVLLFHCCINSQIGLVDEDICNELCKEEQMIILKFCERLNEMEATLNNVECAIRDAYEMVGTIKDESCSSVSVLESETEPIENNKKSSDTDAYVSSESIIKDSSATIHSDDVMVTDSIELNDMPVKEFNSSLTVMPSTISNTSTYSDLISTHSYTTNYDIELEANIGDTDSYIGRGINIYKLKKYANKEIVSRKKVQNKQANLFKSPIVSKTNHNKNNYTKGVFRSITESTAASEKEDQIQRHAKNQRNTEKESSGKHKEVIQEDTKIQIDNHKQIFAKNKIESEEESTGNYQLFPQQVTAADLNGTRKEMDNDVLQQFVSKTKETAATVLNQIVIQDDGATAALSHLVTTIPDKLLAQEKVHTIVASLLQVPTQATHQTVPEKGFAQKATVTHKEGDVQADSKEIKHRRCLEDCICSLCSASGPCCGDFGNTMGICVPKPPSESVQPLPLFALTNPSQQHAPISLYPEQPSLAKPQPVWPLIQPSPGKPHLEQITSEHQFSERSSFEHLNPKGLQVKQFNWKWICLLISIIIATILIVLATALILKPWKSDNDSAKNATYISNIMKLTKENSITQQEVSWECINRLCHRVYQPTHTEIFRSYSRCSLLCMGPQLWPYPVGYTFFSNKIVSIATNKLEYKFKSVPSETVHQYLAEAFKLFLGDLAKLEKLESESEEVSKNLSVKKINIHIDVEIDPDPRLRLNTEESYTLKVESNNYQVLINVASPSFCGIRHGLETLSQLILLDQSTGHLITLSNVMIKDAPKYRYRGLMLDTGRNYIPVPVIMRTIDAMANCKLNTFHWRISDVTSFPLFLPQLPQLFEYGAYDRSMVYTKEDVLSVVHRAGIRGVRVLMEVAAPGPVGRPWSWSPGASCPTKTDNYTCANDLCIRINMQDSVLDVLQIIYSEILEMTKVNDVFHLSDNLFSLSNCFFLIKDREGFLVKALKRLKLANKGNLPKLPIIWYTLHLASDFEAKTWNKLGVQLNDWQSNRADQFLNKFRVIHSSKWDLSCQMKNQRCHKYRTWQEMYSWKSWRNIEVFTTEGGEAILWTDLVNSGNLDYHLWPRAAAVAERLWSDAVINNSASGSVYVRLDSLRWRMLLHSVKVQPVWPKWCRYNPGSCLQKLQ